MKIQPKHELREAGGKKCQCQQLKQCGIVVELKTDEEKRMMHMDQVQECIGINTLTSGSQNIGASTST